MDEPSVLVERQGAVAVLTLNRPTAHNALNSDVFARLAGALDEITRDAGVRAVVITGAGEKSFCAGADLDELVGLSAQEARDHLAVGQQLFQRLEALRVPVLCAVGGAALGGGFELVLASTFAVLSDNATLGLPEAGLGLIPGYGGTQRLPRLIGTSCAAHVMLTGERLTAERAFQLGLTPVPPVPRSDVLPTTIEFAQSIAGRGPRAVSAILEAMATTRSAASDLAHESALAGVVTSSDEAKEGISAFRERRPAGFPDPSGTPFSGEPTPDAEPEGSAS